MSCAETLNTQASIDGEVIGAEAAAAERHIETCAECQTFCADAAALSDDIRKVAGRYRAPTTCDIAVAHISDECGRVSPQAGRPRSCSAKGVSFMTQCFRRMVAMVIAAVVFAGASAEATPKKVTVTVAEFSFTPRYIAVSDLLPQLNRHRHDARGLPILGLVAGLGSAALLLVIPHGQ